MKKVLAVILSLILLTGSIPIAVSAVEGNLVTNGDFESGRNWTGWYYSRVSDPTGSGQGYVMKVEGSTSPHSCNHDSITIKANTYYYYSAKIYREDATGDVYVDMLPSDGGTYLPGSNTGTKETGRWVTVSCIFNSGNYTSVKPHLASEGTTSRKYIYFDDVVLTELSFPATATPGTTKAQFTAATDSTSASFVATDNGLYITDLSTYITQPQTVSLVNRISNQEVTWKFTNYEAISIVSGLEHTVTFRSADGKYELKAVITQQAGMGPLEFNQSITGLTEGISIAYSDIINANIAVQTDGEATLYRFSRSRVNDGDDPYFSQGVLTNTLTPGASVFSSIENYYTVKDANKKDTSGSILPYQVLDVDGEHGIYFGYYWSFGKMLVRMNDSNEIAFTSYLGENLSKSISRNANETLSLPGFFIGTYEGSVDNGSNQMKNWFWDYKMTDTLRENEAEPYIEIGMLGDRERHVDTLFDIWPDIADYVNILKLDFGWTLPDGVDSRDDVSTEQTWVPNSAKNEYVMSDGTINMGLYDAIQRNLATDQSDNPMYFSLYMPDTFEGVDIGTKEGREKQLDALKTRMRPVYNTWGVGYDYWRSDYEVEQSYDYDDHEGLLYILDEMIAYSEDFRYEHCMGGGTLKDFTTLERMTFMTTEDTGLPLNHRMSLYANTYMINPLQLKADIGMGLTSRDYGTKMTGYGNILENGKPGYTDETYVKYALRTGMLGAMMVTFNEAGYRYGNNLEIIKEHYDLYNNTHKEILRNTDVYHILASPTGWDYADWDGIEYYNPELNKGVVQLFKENTTAPNAKKIVLDGLDENTMYRLTFIDRPEQNTIMSGAQLTSQGLTVTGMDTAYASELIYIEPYPTDTLNPTIVNAVAINDTQFKITTSEPIMVKNDGCFALFLEKDGIVANLDERSNANFKENGARYGGKISPANTLTTELIWTINTGVNATNAIHAALDAGYKVYFGINGGVNANNMITTDRAVDTDEKGFIANLTLRHTHGLYGVPVTAYAPNAITSATLLSDTRLEITFANPITTCTDSLFLCLLDENGAVQNGDANSELDNHSPLDYTVTADGKLICQLRNNHPGMSEDGKNIAKFIQIAAQAYPQYRAGIAFLEPTDSNINNTNLLENVTDANGIPLKATGCWTGTVRDTSTAVIATYGAKIQNAYYLTLGEALQVVQAGDTVVLLHDETIADPVFVLDANVTLDLNGHKLSVTNAFTFGDIIDSTEGLGKLAVTKNARVILSPVNATLPLYDADGYRFFSYEFKSAGTQSSTNDSVRFGVQLFFENADAYALLAQDTNANVIMNLSVTKDEKVSHFAFTFSRTILERYNAAWHNRVDLTKTPTLVLTVGGVANVSSITCTPRLYHTVTTVSTLGNILTHSHTTA